MIGLEYSGAEEVQVRLDGMYYRLGDLTAAWNKIHRVFMRFEREVFTSEGSYVGEPWKPLSPRYAAYKLRRYGALPILRVTGHLMKSFTQAGHESHVFRVTATSVEMGSRDFKARYHQEGTKAQRTTAIKRLPQGQRMRRGAQGRFARLEGMPARPPLKEFSRVEGEMVTDILLAHVLRGGL